MLTEINIARGAVPYDKEDERRNEKEDFTKPARINKKEARSHPRRGLARQRSYKFVPHTR